MISIFFIYYATGKSIERDNVFLGFFSESVKDTLKAFDYFKNKQRIVCSNVFFDM